MYSAYLYVCVGLRVAEEEIVRMGERDRVLSWGTNKDTRTDSYYV